ncbi:MAG: hypothetical protein ACU843_03885 [Gammaproteobacteria bacterium]
MNVRRLSARHRIIALLLLFTGLSSQIQVVFACDLMDGLRSSVCCCADDMADGCAMGGGCGMETDLLKISGCCDVSVEPLSDVASIGPSSTLNQVALQIAPQPPPLALFSVSTLSDPQLGLIKVACSGPTDPGFVRAKIYLVTNRLRI